MSVLRRLITAIEAKVDQGGFNAAERRLDGLKAGFERLGSALDSLATQAATVTAGLASIGVASTIKTTANLESLKASLVGVEGSVEAANMKWGQLKQLARDTGVAIDSTTTSYTRMASLGLDASDRTLKAYGDIASAQPEKSTIDFVEAVADAAVGEYERLKEFGIKAKAEGKKVSLTFGDMTLKVDKDAKSIQGALTQIAEQKFGGSLERQAATLGGRFRALQNEATFFAEKVGESGLSASLGRLIDKFAEWTTASDGLAVKLGEGLGAAVDKLAASMEFLAQHSTEAQAALGGVAAVFAGGKIASFIASIGSALGGLAGINLGGVLVQVAEWLKVVRFLGAGASASIGAVVIAFAGLATGIVEGIGIERIMELVKAIASFVTDVIGGIVSAVARIGSAIFTAIFEPARAVGQVIGEILGVFIGPLSAAIEWVGEMFGWLLEVVGDIGVFIADLAGGALMVVAKVIRVIFQLIKKGFDGIVWVLEELGIIDMIKAAWDLLKQVIDWFRDALQKVGDWFRDMFAMLFNPILEIISDSINRLKKIIRALPQNLFGKDISEWAAQDSDFSIKTSDQLKHERDNAAALEGFIGGLAGSGPAAPTLTADAFLTGLKGQSMGSVVNAGGITINVTAADNSPAEIANATKDGTNEALSHFAADIVGVQ